MLILSGFIPGDEKQERELLFKCFNLLNNVILIPMKIIFESYQYAIDLVNEGNDFVRNMLKLNKNKEKDLYCTVLNPKITSIFY
jgi:hypothetical protein